MSDSWDYAYRMVPKNEKLDVPLGWALGFWVVVILVVIMLA